MPTPEAKEAMSSKKRLAAFITLIVVAVTAIAFGLSSAYALYMRIDKLQAGEAHRQIVARETCASCHTSKHKAPLVGACENCHVTSTWQSVSYSHESAYLNKDAHKAATCKSCHTNGGEIKTATCSTCHKTIGHRATTAVFDKECSYCHETKSWTESHKLPREHIRLTGSHATNATCPDCHTIHDTDTTWYCADCHRGDKKHDPIVTSATHKKLECVDCHARDKGQSDNLNTASVKAADCFGCHAAPHQRLERCERCHAKDSFKTKRYAHATWPLGGAHAALDCTKCHSVKKLGTARGTACSSCHGVRHAGLTNCSKCHTQKSFTASTYDHDSNYKLDGAHRQLKCSQCHPRSQWASTKGTACLSCHGTKHGGLTACSQCHSTKSFKPSKFDHASRYRLTGAHTKIACSRCHPGNNYTRTKGKTCVACHGPKHGGQAQCDRCHTTSAWQPIKASFSHTSRYPLVGQHKYVECIGCHKNADYSYTPLRCVDCHAAVSHGMSNCEACHTPESWSVVKGHGG